MEREDRLDHQEDLEILALKDGKAKLDVRDQEDHLDQKGTKAIWVSHMKEKRARKGRRVTEVL